MKVYEVLAAASATEGVDSVFALMGDGNMGFLGSLAEREGVRVVQVRHENMAVGMADGLARAGRAIGVASVTYGPGLTQIPTSLLVAGRHHSHVVVFASEPPQADRYPGSAHEMNQRALMEAAEAAYSWFARQPPPHRTWRVLSTEPAPNAGLSCSAPLSTSSMRRLMARGRCAAMQITVPPSLRLRPPQSKRRPACWRTPGGRSSWRESSCGCGR